MQFANDLEVQRMRMFMDTQVQLDKIKRSERSLIFSLLRVTPMENVKDFVVAAFALSLVEQSIIYKN
ncbi:hypothetical protein V6N11_004571 [Hibiscus sabdariffa]|uniref:Uncharacterized protein n=1 Tax=Hibiscus sabdariffa TaxID=183260 RepID=A0ABR2SHL3_9ROSI